MAAGTMVTPGHAGGMSGASSMDHTYATTNRKAAADYAYASESPDEGDDTPRVYHVEPTGPMHDDTEDGGKGAYKSRHPLRVVGEA